MTEERLHSLVETWKRRLGLEHWQLITSVKADIEIEGDPVFAKLERSRFYDRAVLHVHPGVLDADQLPNCLERQVLKGMKGRQAEEFIEITIVHELLHCAVRDLMETGDLVRSDLSSMVLSVWDGAWRRAEEALVERLALALVQHWGD